MATRVLTLDIERLPDRVEGLEGYGNVYTLFRYGDVPLATGWFPVVDGVFHLADHRSIITDMVTPVYTELLSREFAGFPPVLFPLPKATIAICTRDRTDDLRRCLDALVRLPDDGQEILVVDNAPSTEDTRKLAEAYGIRYVREDKPGLNNARNRALYEAQGEVVAFIDDDAVADEAWLRGHLQHYQRPLVYCVTGMTLPLELETAGQEAFEKYNPFNKGFRVRCFDALHDPLSTGMIGAGANMSVRKSALQNIGPFDPALDAGTATQSGGDHEYFSRILLAGYLIMYEPTALNWHRHRRTMAETRATIKGYGVGMYAYWTKLLFQNGEWGVLRIAWGWFFHDQLKNLIKAILKRGNHKSLDLVLAELSGCVKGPFAYFRSRRKMMAT